MLLLRIRCSGQSVSFLFVGLAIVVLRFLFGLRFLVVIFSSFILFVPLLTLGFIVTLFVAVIRFRVVALFGVLLPLVFVAIIVIRVFTVAVGAIIILIVRFRDGFILRLNRAVEVRYRDRLFVFTCR